MFSYPFVNSLPYCIFNEDQVDSFASLAVSDVEGDQEIGLVTQQVAVGSVVEGWGY